MDITTDRSQIFYRRLSFILLIILWLVLFIIDIMMGKVEIKVSELWNAIFQCSQHSDAQLILYNFRLPKAIAAVLAGVALGISGLLTQTYFRNPLAGPDVLGVSAGASLGVAVVVLVFSQFMPTYFFTVAGSWTIILAACIGAGLTMSMITLIASMIRDHVTLLVLGLMVGAAFSSIITVIQYLSNESLLKSFVVWGFGSIRHLTFSHLAVMTPFVILGTVLAFLSIKSLNALLLGEKYAQTLGIHVNRARLLIFFSIILLAGTITAFCGPIAFVAITVPHLSRMLFRTNDHFVLIPASLMIGGVMMLLSDILSQWPGSDISLPINALTSLMGIPLIITILLRRKMG
ncbi:MAG: iron ABC transporter permease [Bacteroidales bacterium]